MASKLGGLNIKEWLQPRKELPPKSHRVELRGKPTHYPWGKADDMEEVTSKSTPYPTVAEVQTSKQCLAEITSGRPVLEISFQLFAVVQPRLSVHAWRGFLLQSRIADRRVMRLIQKWLNAGVLEDGKRIYVEEGTPQGGSVSPLLANVYLHYVFDLWAQAWRRKRAHGEVIIVRFADDAIIGFQVKADADQFRAELAERMRKFNLELHPEKTQLVEFGPYAIENRKRRGEGKPETFNFLGFTHICEKKRSNGMYTVLRQTIRKRLQAKLNEMKVELRRRMHLPIPEQGK